MSTSTNNSCFEDDLVPSDVFLKLISVVLIMMVVSAFLVLSVVFYQRKNSSALLSSRDNILTYTIVIGSLLQISWAIDSLMDREGFPCLILSNLVFSVFNLQLIPRMISIIHVYFKLILHRQLAKFELVSAVKLVGFDKIDSITAKGLVRDEDEDNFEGDGKENSVNCCGSFCDSIFNESRNENALKETIMLSAKIPGASWREDEEPAAVEHFPHQHVFFFSSKMFPVGLQILVILMVLFNTVALTAEEFSCTSPCSEEFQRMPLFFSAALVMAFLGMCYLYKVRNEPDPLGLVKELQMSCLVILIFGVSVMIFINTDPGDVEDQGRFRWPLLWVFGSFLEILLCLGYPLYLARIHEKYRIKHIGDVSLSKVLGSVAGRDQFKAFLVGEMSVENYLFWRSAAKYKENFSERTPYANRRLRMLISRTYIREEAQLSVNISATSRESVKNVMTKYPEPTDFDGAIEDVLINMESDSFVRFRRTSEFRRLFSDEEEIH